LRLHGADQRRGERGEDQGELFGAEQADTTGRRGDLILDG